MSTTDTRQDASTLETPNYLNSSITTAGLSAKERNKNVKHILIGATGSVASIKIPLLAHLVTELATKNKNWEVEVKIVTTNSALHFISLNALPKGVTLYTDKDEWKAWKKIGDPVLHIQLREWADIVVIAPLDANTMAKIANGYCDNLLTCILRAWDSGRPRVICPAMNTHMWNHPHTSIQIATLKDQLGFVVVDPISKTLACGDTGIGAMAEPELIAKTILSLLCENGTRES
ncbi:hypothetical protein H4219_001376 [Mycoemilia scoparia]|uniref:Flavoprotein domain-containing protein n=1 Tax=Mycoemilia scoparia TaxID=417184 RepID=A0A9W8A3P8_9FUNG|nr:hypothetical protein H4219_001376 [Mycoemilia scoparia]